MPDGIKLISKMCRGQISCYFLLGAPQKNMQQPSVSQISLSCWNKQPRRKQRGITGREPTLDFDAISRSLVLGF